MWGDLLTVYDGKTITYDTIGNPLSDGTWTYTWEHGRELASMSDGSTTWNYEYNADGLRTKRTNGTNTYYYYYAGGQLLNMRRNYSFFRFAYDASGAPMSVIYGGETYFYVTNIQGDVIAILDDTGATVVEYTYDAWGNVLTTTGSMASTLGEANSLRYRGYVYDEETGLYYLQSRYYDPEMGRFINADSYTSTGQGLLGNDMFSYCCNSPVLYVDLCGHASAKIDLTDMDKDGDGVADEPSGPSGGGGIWNTFVGTMKAASKGLTMALGEKEGTQNHHFFSNKNKTYTPKYQEVVDEYGLDLDGEWNIRILSNHKGRHSNAYHTFMEDMLYEIHGIANGDLDEFLYGVGLLEDHIQENPWIPYAK